MKDVVSGLILSAIAAVLAMGLAFLYAAVLAIPTMLLWDYTIPWIFPGTKELDFWHAVTLLVLCALLFKTTVKTKTE